MNPQYDSVTRFRQIKSTIFAFNFLQINWFNYGAKGFVGPFLQKNPELQEQLQQDS